jgi:hypothetical protein
MTCELRPMPGGSVRCHSLCEPPAASGADETVSSFWVAAAQCLLRNRPRTSRVHSVQRRWSAWSEVPAPPCRRVSAKALSALMSSWSTPRSARNASHDLLSDFASVVAARFTAIAANVYCPKALGH